MAPESAEGVVEALVLYDGRLLLVDGGGGWALPSRTPEPGESAGATAARAVYELTGYLVDGTEPLTPARSAGPDGSSAVICQLLSESPSDGASLSRSQVRWTPIPEAVGSGLPSPVRDYLRGHTPT